VRAHLNMSATVLHATGASKCYLAHIHSTVSWVAIGFALAIGAVECSGTEVPSATKPAERSQTFWIVPHTHWEGAVFKTREEYLQIGLPNILLALELLEKYPDYKFVLDQACYVRPFVERYPEMVPEFKKFIEEGRLEIVGGMDVMPDVNMPCGESLVRQILYGKGYFRRALGVDVKVGWLLDTFGHHAQMPQILRLAGIESFWFARGVPRKDTPAEFIWKGLDGTTIPAIWMTPYSYAVAYFSPSTYPEYSKFIQQRFKMLNPFFQGFDRVGLAGADVSIPEPQVPPFVKKFNEQEQAPFKLRFGVPSDYEKVISKHSDRPVIAGERNPIFQGCYSSRIELKQRTRELERLLTNAEKMDVLAGLIGLPDKSSRAQIWQAWEPMLFNQTHDCMGGVMTDHVYEAALSGYDYSLRTVTEALTRLLTEITDNIDTRGNGVPLVVFNNLSWDRTDVAEVEVGFDTPNVRQIQVLNEAGTAVPAQIVSVVRSGTQGIVQAKLAFVAKNVPALGYSLFRVVPQTTATNEPSPIARERSGSVLENEYVRVQIDAATGAVQQIVVGDGEWNALRSQGNVISLQEDRGDFWELYHNLDPVSAVAYTNRQQVPESKNAKFSSDFHDKPGKLISGPVYSEFEVSHPFGDKGKFRTRIRLAHGSHRIVFSTSIVNQEKYVRYQAIFPTSIEKGVNVHEIPFGAIERPLGIELPAQNWADYGNKNRGVAILNHGLPGNITTSNGTMMLSLMRATCITSYGYGGGYEPGMSSDTGFEIGKERNFHYAIEPHNGSWQDSQVYRAGLELNNPLVVQKAGVHEGRLPKRYGILDASRPNVVVSALKPGEGGDTILRVYEAAGQATKNVRIRIHSKVKSACEANLMEDAGKPLDCSDNTIAFDLHPFEIKTIGLQLEGVN
jgi:alpha-mannosidase